MDADIIKDHLHWDPVNKSIYADVPIGFTGELKMWPMANPPAGWLVCDGSLYLKKDYPRLWALLGDTWGTSTTTQFYVPNLAGRVPVGKNTGTFSAIAATGGEEKHTMVGNELAAHTHTLDSRTAIGQMGGSGFNAGLAAGTAYSKVGLYNDTGASSNTGNAGSATPFNVLQPYAVVQYIIKA